MRSPFRSGRAGSGRRLSWSRADLHLHTTHSDGLMTPQETIDAIARQGQLQVIAITDHDTTEGAFLAREYAQRRYAGLGVIIGQEVTTGDGDILGLYLTETLPIFESGLAAIQAIHEQGGLAIAPHPFVGGWKIVSVGRKITTFPFDGVEVRHGSPLSLWANLYAEIVNRNGARLPRLGGSDSHIPFTAGEPFTWFPGRTEIDLRRAIIAGAVRPGGLSWKLGSMLRLVPVIAKRGWPTYTHNAELPIQHG